MADDRKQLEITQDFLEKHRSNTRKYMHLLSKPNEKPTSIQETLTRIESKFGLSIKRSNSSEVPQIPSIPEKTTENDSIQDFIKQIRAKYLASNDSGQESLLKPDEKKEDETLELRRNKSEVIPEILGLEASFPEEKKSTVVQVESFSLSEKSEKRVNLEKSVQKTRKSEKSFEKVNFFHEKREENFEKLGKSEQLTIEDNALLLSDLISEVPSVHSPLSRPPRSKVSEEGHEEHCKEDINRSLHENSMSMSFRRVHTEQLLNSAISEVITSRLGIRKKPQSNPGVFSFESFLNAGKLKFAPLKKVVNFDLVFKNDEILKGLMMRKEKVLKELERLEDEKVKVLELMNKV